MALFSKLPPYIGVKISHFFWQAWKADALPLGDARRAEHDFIVSAPSGTLLSHKSVGDARHDAPLTFDSGRQGVPRRRCGGHGRKVLGQLLLDQSQENPAGSSREWEAV
jgi:hypothetical protein